MHRHELQERQLSALNELLREVLVTNRFYQHKLASISLPMTSLEQFAALPLTTKDELVAAAEVEPPTNLTYPLAQYTRLHQTSGTRGSPLRVYDTASDWQWWIKAWQDVLDSADIEPSDRALMAFSFGPFIGFWSAYDALAARGCLVVPTGGMSTAQRLQMLSAAGANVVCCTPTYAMRMAEVAAEQGIELTSAGVKSIIVAGEPGGSLPPVRDRIEHAWGARVIDHAGATEVGPWGFADERRSGLHVNEKHFIAEFLPVDGTTLKELVLTALYRTGWPVIRYRTGDLVYPIFDSPHPEGFVLLEGGVVGRADEMLIIRGVNIYGSAIEEIVRSVADVDEFRAVAFTAGAMDGLRLEVELRARAAGDLTGRLADLFQQRLGLRVDVSSVPPGTLPRYEAKSRRLVDERN